MKRRVCVLLAVILVFALASVAGAAKATVTLSGAEVKQNFDDYQSTIAAGWGGGFGAWGGNLSNNFTDNFTIENGRLKATYPAGAEATFTIDVDAPGGNVVAFSWHIHNTSSKDIDVRTIFADASNYVNIEEGKKAYLVPDSGDAEEVVANGSDAVTIPAGFSGKLVVPFTSMTKGSWTMDDVKALNVPVGCQIKVQSTVEEGTVLTFDDITYYTGFEATAEGDEEENPHTGDFNALFYAAAAVAASGVLAGLKLRNRK